MSSLEVTRINVPRAGRTVGLRWLRYAARAVLLALHQSRRRMARRIVRQSRHLRDETNRAAIRWPDPV